MNLSEMAHSVLSANDLPVDLAGYMLNSADGSALLALLCNAAAKENGYLYRYKSSLISHAISMAHLADRDVWKKDHTGYGDYPTDTVIFIKVPFVDGGRMQFHVNSDDRILSSTISRLPYRETGWNGILLQPTARWIAQTWIAQQEDI